MQFNSYEFILYFLPLTLLAYFLVNRIKPVWGKLILIASSAFFYLYGRTEMAIYLAISMFINYCGAMLIRRKTRISSRIVMTLTVAVNVGLLLYFKYTGFIISNINIFTSSPISFREMVLPLGISFYTFQQIAYVVATERGEIENGSFIDYAAYILYFPKLIMGPLADPVDFLSQLNRDDKKRPDITNIAVGVKLFSLGLIKKVLFADIFESAVSWTYSNLEAAKPMDCVLMILFYTFEIYFDFSGYSDMAIGVSSMFNIDLPINFDSPYKALSIRDFWKRWHISLTKFLTKYIYIPLGGSRKGTAFTYINTMIVFLISGLWHGANWTFVLWGLLHGLLSCFDRAFDKIEAKIVRPVRWALTFGAVSILWLLFSAESITQWKDILVKALSVRGPSISDGLVNSFNRVDIRFVFDVIGLGYLPAGVKGFCMILLTLSSFAICLFPENNYRKKDVLNAPTLILASLAFIWGILNLAAESKFVYFGF